MHQFLDVLPVFDIYIDVTQCHAYSHSLPLSQHITIWLMIARKNCPLWVKKHWCDNRLTASVNYNGVSKQAGISGLCWKVSKIEIHLDFLYLPSPPLYLMIFVWVCDKHIWVFLLSRGRWVGWAGSSTLGNSVLFVFICCITVLGPHMKI